MGSMRTLPPPPTLSGVDRRLTQYLQELVSKFNSLSTEVRDMAISIPAIPTTPSSPSTTPENESPSTPTNPSQPTTGTGGTGGGGSGDPGQVLPTLPTTDSIRSQSRIYSGLGGNVEGALGMLARPQLPYIPTVTQLPPRGDSQSQNGSAVIFNDSLYTFVGGVDIGSWIPTGGSPTSGNERVYTSNITGVTYNGAAGVNGSLHQTPIPAGDLNMLSKVFRITGYGTWSTAPAQTPVFFLTVRFDNATVPIGFISFGNTLASTASSAGTWLVEVLAIVIVTGVTGNIKAVGKFYLDLLGDSVTRGKTVYTERGIIGSINLTIAHSLDFTIQFSTQSGGPQFNQFTQEYSLIELLN